MRRRRGGFVGGDDEAQAQAQEQEQEQRTVGSTQDFVEAEAEEDGTLRISNDGRSTVPYLT